jgi:hypothetical protein
MSRRSRKRNGGGASRWLVRSAVGLLVLAILSLGVGYGLLRRYLHSDSFRKFLSEEASSLAGVTGEFAPFRWEGLAVDTESFEAKGESTMTSLRADGLHTEIGLGGVTRGVWEVRGSSLRRLDISMDLRQPIAAPSPPPAPLSPISQKSNHRPRWFPSEAELLGLEVQQLTAKVVLNQGLLLANDLSIRAEPAGTKGAYRLDVRGGTMRLPYGFIPELRLDRAELRHQDRQLFLTGSTIKAWENGRIQASGEYDLRTKRFSLEGDVSGLKCDDLLSENWAKRLTGDIASTFIFENPSGIPQARGTLEIQNGVMTALPVLDTLAAYADTRRFRVLSLSEAHTEWNWKTGELRLTNVVLASEGLARVEGRIVIRGEELDGEFRLGLAPGTLSAIPGAETDVFASGERGLLWTPLRISGTLDRPREDLSDRLIAAAGARMFDRIPETGEKVIKFTHSLLGDPSPKTVEKGVKIIEESSKTLREVSGILDGILGGSRRPDPKKEDTPQ